MERSQASRSRLRVANTHLLVKPAPGLHDSGGVLGGFPTPCVSKNSKPLRVNLGVEGMTRGDPECHQKNNSIPFHKHICPGEDVTLEHCP